MRKIVMSLAIVSLAIPLLTAAGDEPKSEIIVVAAAAPTAPTPATKDVTAPKVSKRIGFLERRRLGVNFANVVRVAREMDAAGELDREHPDAMAAQVLQRIMAENPEEFQKVKADRDWPAFFEALLAFLEQILPIILQFFTLINDTAIAVGPSFVLAA